MAKKKFDFDLKKNPGNTPLVQGTTFDGHKVKKGDILWQERLRKDNKTYEVAQAKIEEIHNGYACYFSWVDGTKEFDEERIKDGWLPWSDVWSFFKKKEYCLAWSIWSLGLDVKDYKKEIKKWEDRMENAESAIKKFKKELKGIKNEK